MPDSEKAKFAFDINWKITLLSALFLPLLIHLGFWQLSRAQEKQTLQELWAQQQALPPVSYAELNKEDLNKALYRRVSLKGQFEQNKYWLLENKIQQSRLGYHVLMPFKTSNNNWLIINRGWVAAKAYREELPEFTTPKQELELVGMLVQPTDSKFINEIQTTDVSWPHRLLEIDIELMEKQIGVTLGEHVLQVDPDNRAALDVYWKPINMSPAKHHGYAVQWFCMAIALTILWLFANSNLAQIIKRP